MRFGFAVPINEDMPFGSIDPPQLAERIGISELSEEDQKPLGAPSGLPASARPIFVSGIKAVERAQEVKEILNRRDFLRVSVGGVVAFRAAHAMPGDKFRWACTSGTFRPLPNLPDDALKMLSDYGFHGIEASLEIEKPCGSAQEFKKRLDRYNIACANYWGAGQSVALSNPTPNEWFNIDAFAENPVGQFGNVGRDTVIGPGIVDWDASALKNFNFNEQRLVQFRLEIFNALNHPNFADPAKDEAAGEQCRSYGAPAIMRVPGRIHITWRDDHTLKVETDAGQQTRLFHFGDWKAPVGPASWQGDSLAQWGTPRARRGDATATSGRAKPASGNLKVVTTHLRPGYLRKNVFRTAIRRLLPNIGIFRASIPWPERTRQSSIW